MDTYLLAVVGLPCVLQSMLFIPAQNLAHHTRIMGTEDATLVQIKAVCSALLLQAWRSEQRRCCDRHRAQAPYSDLLSLIFPNHHCGQPQQLTHVICLLLFLKNTYSMSEPEGSTATTGM